jgi:hypothetical protein
MRRSLYKYFTDRRWAEDFLKGTLLFHSLAYFRDYEDQEVRGDENEGIAIYRPKGGLEINNLTRAKSFTLLNSTFESAARQDEIFVFCLSRSFTDELRAKFKSVACVEVRDVSAFCSRVQAALPSGAKFPGPSGRTRIGWRVEYYDETEGGSPRWALPDKIATAKCKAYTWQDEFRLVFCLTDALAFEKVDLRLVQGYDKRVPRPAEHHPHRVAVGSLHDICHLYPS